MFRILIAAISIACILPGQGAAQDKDFSLKSPKALIDSGFIKFLLPRFSLKTGVLVDVKTAENGEAYFSTSGEGEPVFQGLGNVYSFGLTEGNSPRHKKAQRFADWLVSDVGKRTIEQFSPNGKQVFTLITTAEKEVEFEGFGGNAALGETLAFTNCGRCHVIGERNKMQGIGSTPSFALLRSLDDWQQRFETFYLRRPHPVIMQIDGITEPFDPAHPPTIHPLTMTETEVLDILTYAHTIQPADLGAALVMHQ